MISSHAQNHKSIPSGSVNSLQNSSQPITKEANAPRSNSSEAARRASAAVLGIAALSMGATAGVLLPSQTKAAIATEAAIANAQIPLQALSEAKSEATAPSAIAPKRIEAISETKTEMKTEQTTPVPYVVASPIIEHKVEQGDTLWEISKDYGTNPETIAASNALESEEVLAVGQTLKIPAISGASEESSKADALQETSKTSFISTANNTDENESSTRKDLSKSPESTDTLKTPQAIAPTARKSSVVVPREAIAATTQENGAVVGIKSASSTIVPTVNLDSAKQAESQAVSLSAVTGAVYRVRVGDTLQTIADGHGILVSELMQSNEISDPRLLQVDRELKIPRSREVRDRVSQSPTVVDVTETSEPTLIAQTTTQARIPSIDSDDARLEQLKNDIMRLREEYRQQQNGVTAPVSSQPRVSTRPVAEVPAAPTAIERNSLSKPTLTVPVEDRRQNRSRNQNPPLTPSTERSNGSETPLVATAPAPSQGYNRLSQMPAGQTVEPQIPPLEDRDRYLPDSPQVFNGYMWPARGTLTSGYGPRWGRMHKGIDIAAPTGTPVYAAGSGEVVSAGWNSGGYGNLVDIRHPDGSLTRYAHNSKILVRQGERVEQGQQISLMGSTGFSTGPHLHFEVHPSGSGAANPMAFLPRNR
ncbi:peptidoglycan DD-metalloendopeptidase family protein [Spirulina sp. 06S082]|uniref:peptidoglycan DD-metalloendopeptidase family protein n=1 Tax=Spirulina sp. 06S082 TaxID=3110248 RepID=UPI002B1F9C63|nr:peptidoglycan DD-metalloendopeptidase family protein [Spirulina sp. 06S082]MEA5467295.1 peptidoglycan DD-metalloendopeptidase family protein [Spirulina sp. 06S082]